MPGSVRYNKSITHILRQFFFISIAMKLTSFRTSILVAAMLSALAPGIASAGLFDDDEARKAILDLRANWMR